jgi:ParB-like chromosome segregation protein Spo0J
MKIVEVDVSQIVAGHGRFLAGKQLEMTKFPCLYIENLTDDQIKAYKDGKN